MRFLAIYFFGATGEADFYIFFINGRREICQACIVEASGISFVS